MSAPGTQFRSADTAWMERALELAARAEADGEVPVGAVVVDDSGLLGEGWNRNIDLCDPTAHAELLALREAGRRVGNYRLPGCTLYVTLEPCPMCAGAIVWARLKRLVFGAFDEKAGAASTLYQIPQDERLNHHVEVVSGLEADRAAALMQDFFRQRRRGNDESMSR